MYKITVINDVVDCLTGSWNEFTAELPTIAKGTEKFSRAVRDYQAGDIVYVTNPRSFPLWIDPSREYKDTAYEVNIECVCETTGRRDEIFNEVYRIIEATGVSGYHNRIIHEYSKINQFQKFIAGLRFSIIKYGQSVAR